VDAIVFGGVRSLKEKVDLLETKINELSVEVYNSNKILVVEFNTLSVLPGQTVSFNQLIESGINKLLIKSIFVEGVAGSQIDVELLSSNSTSKFLFYKNVVSSNFLYDIVDLPYIDYDNLNQLHGTIKNTGNTETVFNFRILGVVYK